MDLGTTCGGSYSTIQVNTSQAIPASSIDQISNRTAWFRDALLIDAPQAEEFVLYYLAILDVKIDATTRLDATTRINTIELWLRVSSELGEVDQLTSLIRDTQMFCPVFV